MAGKTEDADDADLEAESLGKAAPAATEEGGVKSKVSEVLEAVKTAIVDSDGDRADHDEL